MRAGTSPTHRVVIDTNIWISAALSPGGAPAGIVRQVLAHCLPIFSEATFAELETRLWRAKFDRYLSMELRHCILHDLSAAAYWVKIPAAIASQKHCRDANDDKFIHTALSAQAQWLITGDQDLLALHPLQDIQILTPAEALQKIIFLL